MIEAQGKSNFMRFFMLKYVFILFVLFIGISQQGMSEPGIQVRQKNTSLVINDLPSADPQKMQVKRLYPQLRFRKPIFLGEIPDGSKRLFVAQQNGVIYTFDKRKNATSSDRQIFLDIRSQVRHAGEQGLLGVAFDPDYKSNGVFYVHYSCISTNPGSSRISRFTNKNPASNNPSIDSEKVILEVEQPFSNHNGGMIAFGPDKMLYISLGDGGSGGDPQGHGQNTKTLLGNILRIDVRSRPDRGLQYKIPRDNPFFNSGPDGSQTRKEIYAYGLRNVWRFSFDRQHNFLMAADVGQNALEEINVIESGKNYGWNIMEGDRCFFLSPNCDTEGLTFPIATYGRNEGISVTGGYVYYGTKTPDLFGVYLYTDYISGKVWGLKYNGSRATDVFTVVENSGIRVSSFGQDLEGEIYLLDHSGGGLYQLENTTPRESDFPVKLSEIPALLAAGKGQDQTNLGIIPYRPISVLWSDGLTKSRFMALPDLLQMNFTMADGYTFPEKTVLIKNFNLLTDERNPKSEKVIETRLLYKRNGRWHGFSYEWNAEGTDALLLTDDKIKTFNIKDKNGRTKKFKHLYPSRNQCFFCHSPKAKSILGITTPLLNHDFKYPESQITSNQLETLNFIQMFQEGLPQPPEKLPKMPNPYDPKASLQDRARSYLAINCGTCHRPKGPTPARFDLRWETPNEQMGVIGVEPERGDLGISDALLVAKGKPEKSLLYLRMISNEEGVVMPPLGRFQVDKRGSKLIKEWIQNLE